MEQEKHFDKKFRKEKRKTRAAIHLYVKTIRNYFMNRLPYSVHKCRPFSI